MARLARCLVNMVGLLRTPLVAIQSYSQPIDKKFVNTSNKYLIPHEEDWLRSPLVFQWHKLPRWALNFSSVQRDFDPMNIDYNMGVALWMTPPLLFLILSVTIIIIFNIYEIYKIPDYRLTRRFKTQGLRKQLIEIIAVKRGFDVKAMSQQIKNDIDINYGKSRYLLPVLSTITIALAIPTLIGSAQIQYAVYNVRKDIRQFSILMIDLKDKAIKVKLTFQEAANKMNESCSHAITCYGFDKQMMAINKTQATYMDLFEEYITWALDDVLINMAESFIRVDKIRFPVTIFIVLVVIIMNILLIYGILYSSTYELIRAQSLFGLAAVIICWLAIGIYLVLLIMGSDMCVDPDKFLLSLAYETRVVEDLIMFFAHCNPDEGREFKVPDHLVFLKQFQNYIEPLVRTLGSCVSSVCPRIMAICKALDVVQTLVTQVNIDLNNILSDVRCNPIHPIYVDLMTNCCHNLVLGLFVSLIPAFLSAILFMFISMMSGQLYLWLRRQETTLQTELRLLSARRSIIIKSLPSRKSLQIEESKQPPLQPIKMDDQVAPPSPRGPLDKKKLPDTLPPVLSSFVENSMLSIIPGDNNDNKVVVRIEAHSKQQTTGGGGGAGIFGKIFKRRQHTSGLKDLVQNELNKSKSMAKSRRLLSQKKADDGFHTLVIDSPEVNDLKTNPPEQQQQTETDDSSNKQSPNKSKKIINDESSGQSGRPLFCGNPFSILEQPPVNPLIEENERQNSFSQKSRRQNSRRSRRPKKNTTKLI